MAFDRDRFGVFVAEISARLEKGERDYGGKSFERSLPDLCDELQQELLDVSGWSWIMWCKLEDLKEKISALEYLSQNRKDDDIQ